MFSKNVPQISLNNLILISMIFSQVTNIKNLFNNVVAICYGFGQATFIII
ncbi:Exodeoxyribonuclease III [Rickettsia prowazekii str. Breinl]|nr:Exodeoxyribonuclease III [Rickettsia prowazekii str. Breinl]